MKKLIALTLSALLLAGCTAGTPRKRPQPSSEIPSSSSTSEPEVISEVTAVCFNRDEINFNLNQENPYTVETLIATVSGIGNYDHTVTWVTSNKSIVTVENGVVSADGEILDGIGLERAIVGAIAENPGVRIHIIADKDTPYKYVNSVVSVLQNLQHRVVSFVIKERT